ncbi:hypothetical protein K4H00_23520, partial [Mycobacterium tuberculosis]|nr:hypothetical protein [Mycobacterium tuberculosis]
DAMDWDIVTVLSFELEYSMKVGNVCCAWNARKIVNARRGASLIHIDRNGTSLRLEEAPALITRHEIGQRLPSADTRTALF